VIFATVANSVAIVGECCMFGVGHAAEIIEDLEM
jgi:hypothetical protein